LGYSSTDAGEIAIFANNRVLHGREAYSGTEGQQPRHLIGCYFTYDAIRSKLRVLQRRLGTKVVSF
jgi:alpha-ketoglutarate-dependent taurine dioxygenase